MEKNNESKFTYDGKIVLLFWNAIDATEYSWDQPEMPWMYNYDNPDEVYKVLVNRKEHNRIYVRDYKNQYIRFTKFLESKLHAEENRLPDEMYTESILAIAKQVKNRSLKGRSVIYEFSAGENSASITRRDDLMNKKQDKTEN